MNSTNENAVAAAGNLRGLGYSAQQEAELIRVFTAGHPGGTVSIAQASVAEALGRLGGTGTVHFEWMGAYWSCSSVTWTTLENCVSKGEPFDLETLGARELRSRPKGRIHVLRDVLPRGAE